MRVRFNRKCTYPQVSEAASRVYEAGEVYDLEPNHARRWIRRGAAEEVPEEPKPVAVAPPAKPEPKKIDKPEPKGK